LNSRPPKPKKLLIISYLDHPFGAGLSRRITGITSTLRDADFEVEVVSPVFRSATRPQAEGNTIVDLRFLRALGENRLATKILALGFFCAFALVRIVSLRRRLIAVQYESAYSFPPAFLARILCGLRCIGDDVHILGRGKLATTLKLLCGVATDLLLSSAAPMRFERYRRTRVLHVPNGVTENFHFDRRSLSFRQIRAIFVGSLSYRANMLAVNHIITASQRTSDDCRFLIVGGPVPRTSRSTSRVQFLGHLDDAALLRAYQDTNVGILPFFGVHAEGPKIKLLEYMAARLLVISSPEGVEGYPDLIAREHYLPVGSVEEMAPLLRGIAGDSDAYAEIAERGCELALTKYRWPTLLVDYVNFLTGLELRKKRKTEISQKDGPKLHAANHTPHHS
jgi:glycosyltransferase involved in cell wall biosynthesis